MLVNQIVYFAFMMQIVVCSEHGMKEEIMKEISLMIKQLEQKLTVQIEVSLHIILLHLGTKILHFVHTSSIKILFKVHKRK